MTDTITLTGLVGTDPKHTITDGRVSITSFRLASTQRRFDRAQSKWVDGETNWYSVSTFRQLAVNTATSISKGDRIIVTGRVRLRDWQTEEKSGMSVDVEADALGHDLSWGTAKWARTAQPQSSNQSSNPSSTADSWRPDPATTAPGEDDRPRQAAGSLSGSDDGAATIAADTADTAETPF